MEWLVNSSMQPGQDPIRTTISWKTLSRAVSRETLTRSEPEKTRKPISDQRHLRPGVHCGV